MYFCVIVEKFFRYCFEADGWKKKWKPKQEKLQRNVCNTYVGPRNWPAWLGYTLTHRHIYVVHEGRIERENTHTHTHTHTSSILAAEDALEAANQ